MRRVLSGFVPLAMAGAALFAAAPAASAAPSAVRPAAATSCQQQPPPYGPGSGCATVTITVHPAGPHSVIVITFTAKGFMCGENVTITAGNPSRVVATFTATCSGAAAVGSTPYQGVVSGNIQLPAGYGPGEHSLTALGTQSGVVGSSSFTISSTSGNIVPCTASASNVQSSGIVLAAAYLSASCKSALPATAGGPPSSGSNGNAAISNGVGASNGVAAVGTATTSSASELPFTGFNAATVAASGAILVGAGGALVLVSRRRRRNAWQ